MSGIRSGGAGEFDVWNRVETGVEGKTLFIHRTVGFHATSVAARQLYRVGHTSVQTSAALQRAKTAQSADSTRLVPPNCLSAL
jgi:hypothetical protein